MFMIILKGANKFKIIFKVHNISSKSYQILNNYCLVSKYNVLSFYIPGCSMEYGDNKVYLCRHFNKN